MERNNKYAFTETVDTLSSRVASHVKFSNFSLHEWIKDNFNIKKGDVILDLGCGDGNYTELFWNMLDKTGLVIGMDKNKDLIEKARTRYAEYPQDSVEFIVSDYDKNLALDRKYTWIFSIYAIYYVSNPKRIIQDLKNHLKDKGNLVLIGPGKDNGRELINLNYEITGIKPTEEYIERLGRIEQEFLPIAIELFGKEAVNFTEIKSQMSFPTIDDLNNYYWASMLWRNSTENLDENETSELKKKTKDIVSNNLPFSIDKQMVCLRARNT